MARIEENIHKLKYPGAVDADGHILESAKCWEEYCEAKYRANAIRMKEDKDGLEYLEVNGVPSRVNRGGNFGSVAQMGQVSRNSGQLRSPDQIWRRCPARRLRRQGPPHASRQRGARRRHHLSQPRPDLGDRSDDADYSQAMCRAYNRWVTDWCADSGGRLIPVAHLSLGDPAAAAAELERAVKAGHKGGWVVQFTTTRKPHGHQRSRCALRQGAGTRRAARHPRLARTAMVLAGPLRQGVRPQADRGSST